jgi:hypothetical protein
MDRARLLSDLGLSDGHVVRQQSFEAPSTETAHGRGAAQLLSLLAPLTFASWHAESLELGPYEQDPGCILVKSDASPARTVGTVRAQHGGWALDGRDGPAAVTFEDGDDVVVVAVEAGHVEVLRVEGTDPAEARLDAWSPRPLGVAASLPAIAEVMGSAELPEWLVDHASTLATSPDPADQLAALGVIARLAGPEEQVARLRRWARSLTPADVAELDRLLLAEAAAWDDDLERLVEEENAQLASDLVLRRDRLHSLLALRSLAGLGSPARARVAALDRRATAALSAFHDVQPPEPRALLRATLADEPEAWWAGFVG